MIMALALVLFLLNIRSVNAETIDCCENCGVTVSMVIPWVILTSVSYLFYYHLTHSCGKCHGIQKELKQAFTQGKKRYQEEFNVATPVDRVCSVISLTNSHRTPVCMFNTNNNSYLNEKFKEEGFPVTGEQFRGYMQIVTEFVIEYVRNPDVYDVTTDARPGFIYSKLPAKMPNHPEKFSALLSDLYEKILPGLAHWNHPQFHGYFPTGVSYPDIIAETLISAFAVVTFSWDSSPAMTELEVVMVNWFGRAIGLPDDFLFKGRAFESKGGGAIQSSASDAVLVAVVSARTKKLRELVDINDPDRYNKESEVLSKLVAYASVEAHTCIDKACKLAMVRLRSIPASSDKFSLRGKALESEVVKDIERGLIPFLVHCTSGSTATCSFDDLEECSGVAKKYGMWTHVDAAYAGSALICPEFRHLMRGYELADSIDINTHKMLLCSATCAFLWTKHHAMVKETFAVNPLYLRKTHADSIDFRDWGISLSRRGKALKLWFLFRMYGLSHLQEYIRRLIRLTARMVSHLKTEQRIELVGEQHLSLVCFRVKHSNSKIANERTNQLCMFINKSRRLFITHACPNDIDVVRICVGQERTNETDIDKSWLILKELLDEFFTEYNWKKSPKGRFLFEADRVVQPSPVASLQFTQRTTLSVESLTSLYDSE